MIIKMIKNIYFLKCYNPTSLTGTPSCTTGPDHLCSDGKCYSQSGCPTGFTITNTTCRCGNQCSGTSTSSLQVLKFFYI